MEPALQSYVFFSFWPQWSFGIFGIHTPGEFHDDNVREMLEKIQHFLAAGK